MSSPCDDLRILDLSTGPAGGLATMVLADFGADVVKVEPPGGDPSRAEAAAPMWLRGKRSVALDVGQAEQRESLLTLVGGADVVVVSAAPAEVTRLAIDYATLAALNPALIYCWITAWGPAGPYADYPADAALVAAKTGRMQPFSGIVRREGPAFPAVRAETHAAAQSAISGILAAVLARDRTGRGQLVQTSLLQGTFPYDLSTLVRRQLVERYPQHFEGDPFGLLTPDSMPTLGYQPIMGQDGRWIQLANLLEHLFFASIEALELTEQVHGNPRYAGAPRALEPGALEEVRNLMLERARERPAAEWMERFQENGNVAGDWVGTAQEALSNPDMLANGEVVELEHPRLGRTRQLGPLARLMDTPAEPRGYVAEPGEHTAEVLAETPRPPTVRNGAASSPQSHPLEGITVLEFATIIAAPLGTALLADMGARVIKVEPVGGGDPMRTMGVGLGAHLTVSKTTAGKESVCIDLKSERGQELVGRLIERTDVLVHNYRPGVPERLGIGFERSRELQPGIIHLSVNGYGPDGPGARRPAAHPIPGAVDGGALMQAGRGWPPDTSSLDGLREAARWFYRANEANPDPNTSVAVASTALLGLHARRRTGRGQQAFLSMLGANAYANFDDFLSFDGKPPRPTLDEDLFGTGACYRLYPAADGWVFLALRDDASWREFCAATERADLAADARYASVAGRSQHDAELAAALGELFATRGALAWERLLAPRGVGCVEASDQPPGAFYSNDEQMRSSGLAVEAEHPVWGRYQRWGPTVRFSDAPERFGAGTYAGQHTDAILAELGCSDGETAELRARGVVDSQPPMVLS